MRRTLALLLLGACGGAVGTGGDDISGDDVVTVDAAKGPPDAREDLVRFIAMGDTGEGNEDQRRVAVAIRDLCAVEGCDFVLLLGDNIYDAGAGSVEDQAWQDKFEIPYADVDLPFYAVLGNHDYGGTLLGLDVGGLGNEFDKGPVEVAYTQESKKWKMPASHYTLRWGHVGIIALDTNSILWDNTDHGDQEAWWPTALAEVSGARWTFVAGHHPYRSNGTHGNAGDYDAPELAGIIVPNPLPIQDGNAVKAFFEDTVCGNGGVTQVYFSGHDHSRQWLDEADTLCGNEMIVSGAGSKTTDIIDRGNAAFYEDATEPGFMWVEVDGDTFTGKFYDADGNLDFERTFQHP